MREENGVMQQNKRIFDVNCKGSNVMEFKVLKNMINFIEIFKHKIV